MMYYVCQCAIAVFNVLSALSDKLSPLNNNKKIHARRNGKER